MDLSTRRYRPTRTMADLVAALDGMCRGPGCTVPTDRCDVDHDTPWSAGPTRIGNLSDKHRRHHNHKTRGIWTATTDPDGAITWRASARRRYVSHRHNYQDPLTKPVTEMDIQRALADDPPHSEVCPGLVAERRRSGP
ncbi:MAG: HNH endonuclease signature motif containing protein [Lapillicoccus sp.]